MDGVNFASGSDEYFPKEAKENGWVSTLDRDLVEDAIFNVCEYKGKRTLDEFLKAFIYYYENDAFIESLLLNSTVFIGDDDNEEYTTFVYSNSLELYCHDEMIQDVVDNAVYQKPSVSNQEVAAAIEYYSNKNTFMGF